ncbi:MAG: hypothetical protein Q7V53_07675 [Caldisericota bacterium]|nr:hypothetical protein [Caldisericota bacterium]
MNIYGRNTDSTLMDDQACRSIADACRVHMADVLAPMERSVAEFVMRCVRERDERRRRSRSLWLSFAPAFVTAAVLMLYTGTMLPSVVMRSSPTGDASVPRTAESAVPPDDSAMVAKGAGFTGDVLATTQATPLLRIELGGSAVAKNMLVGLLNSDYPELSAMLMAGTRGEEVLLSVDSRANEQLRIIARVYGLRVATGKGLWLPAGYMSQTYEPLSGDATGTPGLTICVVP